MGIPNKILLAVIVVVIKSCAHLCFPRAKQTVLDGRMVALPRLNENAVGR